MIDQDYHDGNAYEYFIRRAFSYQRFNNRIGYWNDKLSKVGKKVESALDKFLTLKLNTEERQKLEQLKARMQRPYVKADLVEIINEGLDATQRFKERMK